MRAAIPAAVTAGRAIGLALTAWGGLALAQMEELTPLEDDTPEVPVGGAPADAEGAATPAAAAPVILEEFTVDERTVVLSAARTRTTIQEAPGIVTVITAEEIRQRGHRTVNDVLRAVPGFEGGRLEANGWFNEATARGTPRTLLILINGVNVTEPVRNALSLDRKIPVDAIKRIEVTSGPGGVLWGSNALLGVVNIILKDADDLQGLQVIVGGGHGAAAQQAAKGDLAFADRWLDGKIKLFTSLSYYTDKGDELQVDAIKVLGVLPEPALDGTTIYQDESGVTDFNRRDWWLSHTLSLQLFDKLTLDSFLQFEEDYRQIATGGALLRGTRAEGGQITPAPVHTRGDDSLQVVSLGWRDRYLDDKFGLSAKVYGARFSINEDPFWAFPPRAIDNVDALADGVVIDLRIGELYRFGSNLDLDLELGRSHHLVFGAEVFTERLRDATRSDVLRRRVLIPGLGEPDAMEADRRDGVFGPGRCPPPGRQTVDVRGAAVDATFGADCAFRETLILDTDRTVGALYISDEWKAARTLALQPGFRVQFSDSYDPVTLTSAALVWNVISKVFVKLNYAEGFRPPSLEATRINNNSVSTVSYQSDDGLRVERSRSTEAEINAIVFEDSGPLRRIYLRGDYAYTVLSDVVRNVSGRFANSGERGIHSVEWLARADFKGEHELWIGGHFTRAEDSVFGPVRNFPNWVFMGGGRLRILPRHLELSTLATFIGPQEDLNRPADLGAAIIPGYRFVSASDVEVDRIDPYVLLRVGVRAFNLWEDRLEIAGFVYNALDQRRSDPDFFFDDRVISRPQPREGWSAFLQTSVRFF